jgi:hypothetical protein
MPAWKHLPESDRSNVPEVFLDLPHLPFHAAPGVPPARRNVSRRRFTAVIRWRTASGVKSFTRIASSSRPGSS